MTYYNGNPYHGPTPDAPLDKWAHDGCLPDSEFNVTMLDDFTTGRDDPVTGFRVYDKIPHRHQRFPWHWDRIYGEANPCAYCGAPTERETRPGVWEPTEPVSAATDSRRIGA